jgi:hypothetical protein
MLSWRRRPDHAENASVDSRPVRMGGAASIRASVPDADANLRERLRKTFEPVHIEVEGPRRGGAAYERAARHPDIRRRTVGMPDPF